MGFSVTQIINKFLSTKRVDDDLRENPFNTPHGQEVVSVKENFWMRLMREGRHRPSLIRATAVSGANLNTDYYPLTLASPLDAVYYPTKIILSADVDSELLCQVQTGLKDQGNRYFNAFCKAGTPLVLTFNGDVCMWEGGLIKVGIKSATAGNMYATIDGIEVSVSV